MVTGFGLYVFSLLGCTPCRATNEYQAQCDINAGARSSVPTRREPADKARRTQFGVSFHTVNP
jgi:hypothetical protein